MLGDGIPAADYLRTKQDPTWGKYVYDASEIATYYVFMNVNEKPFTDVKVRQAVNYAINTVRIQKLLAGQAKALNQIYPEGMPGHQADQQFYTYDPEKAKQLLAEAGFPDGFEVTFYGHNVDPFPKLAQAVQNDLAAVGIDASIKLMDKATYWDFISLPQSHAGIGLTDWYQDFPDPSDFIGPLYTHPIEGGANANFYQNAEVDKLYAAPAASSIRRSASTCSCRCRTSSWPTPLRDPVPARVRTGCAARTSAATTTTPSGASSSRRCGSWTVSDPMTTARRKASRRDGG